MPGRSRVASCLLILGGSPVQAHHGVRCASTQEVPQKPLLRGTQLILDSGEGEAGTV